MSVDAGKSVEVYRSVANVVKGKERSEGQRDEVEL